MKSLDQQEQWHQLTDTYRHMAEEELYQVAADAFDLIPLAREALQAVISERGLKTQLALAPPPAPELSDYQDDTEDPAHRLVCVRKVCSESETKQLKALLDANFIASCLGPENIVDLEISKEALRAELSSRSMPSTAVALSRSWCYMRRTGKIRTTMLNIPCFVLNDIPVRYS